MELSSAPPQSQKTLLQDAARRDRKTARRVALLDLLWEERYLTREQLRVRIEAKLGRGCFGASAWENTFYRDMRVVKRAFKAAGYVLRYSRSGEQSGYYLQGQPAMSPKTAGLLGSSVLETDPAQIRVFQRLSPAERFRLGCSISDTARKTVTYRIRQRYPELSSAEANRQALEKTE